MHKVGIAAAALLVAGCSAPGSDARPPQTPSVGMANPASVYCTQKGGTLSIENTPSGQIGICTLPDGSKIEEWALYRRDHPNRP